MLFWLENPFFENYILVSYPHIHRVHARAPLLYKLVLFLFSDAETSWGSEGEISKKTRNDDETTHNDDSNKHLKTIGIFIEKTPDDDKKNTQWRKNTSKATAPI